MPACTKESTPVYNPNIKSSLSVEFDNIAGASDLNLNTGVYTNTSGENFSVSKLKYFVSNFIFTSTDGSLYKVPQDSCYFLIDESNASTHEPVIHLPQGEYKTIQFTIGIDSLRSTMAMDKPLGVLDIRGAGADMYWSLDSGYIFFNIEGISTASGTGDFKYHIGGYGAMTSPVLNNIHTIILDLSARGMPIVATGHEPNIHLMVDILKVFNGTPGISIAANPFVGFDDFSRVVSGNYTDMFRHDHTEN